MCKKSEYFSEYFQRKKSEYYEYFAGKHTGWLECMFLTFNKIWYVYGKVFTAFTLLCKKYSQSIHKVFTILHQSIHYGCEKHEKKIF